VTTHHRLREASDAVRDRAAQFEPPTFENVAPVGRAGRPPAGIVVAVVVVLAMGFLAASRLPSGGGETTVTVNAPADPVTWTTPFVSLAADDFAIRVKGVTFRGDAADADLHSDPGVGSDGTYTTLERSWRQNGVEMRLNIYFHADAKQWWASEIRIYNGEPRGNWIMFTGDYFRTTIGQPFVGDLDLRQDVGRDSGSLEIHGLRLQAFRQPTPCSRPSGTFRIEMLNPTIKLNASPNEGASAAVRILDNTCAVVADESPFAMTWSVDDPTLLAAFAPCQQTTGQPPCAFTSIQLKGLKAGETTLRATLTRRSDQSILDRATIRVSLR